MTTESNGLATIEAEAKKAKRKKGPAPVHLWNPPFCGDLDMRIAFDGTWFYMGTPIGRLPLVKLFASVLRHDEDGKYYLVTPVEKCGIAVEDVPFVAVEMDATGKDREQILTFRTNVDDHVRVDADHPLRFEDEAETDGLRPYILVRGRLEARVARAVFYELVNLGRDEMVDSVSYFGVWSSGQFFPMAESASLADVR
ncbi:MAG: DUF1285 domain-containing protein [Fimbriimonadaceae bacterium]|nr:DUF1285 domain-containing protein [Alphaproteobacteria bacterium]